MKNVDQAAQRARLREWQAAQAGERDDLRRRYIATGRTRPVVPPPPAKAKGFAWDELWAIVQLLAIFWPLWLLLGLLATGHG